MFSFLWKGKIDKISRKTIINRKHKEGGVNLIDIERHTVALKILTGIEKIDVTPK